MLKNEEEQLVEVLKKLELSFLLIQTASIRDYGITNRLFKLAVESFMKARI